MREILINTRTYATGLTLNDVRCAERSMEALIQYRKKIGDILENSGATDEVIKVKVSEEFLNRLNTCELPEYVRHVKFLINSICPAEPDIPSNTPHEEVLLKAA